MPDHSQLVTLPSPTDHPFVIEHVAEEFTSVCPVTGHPDFGTVRVRFCPGASCVELKSLKLYLWSFRDEGQFHEAVTNRILDDLLEAVSPRKMTIIGDFFVRGGIKTIIEATFEGTPKT